MDDFLHFKRVFTFDIALLHLIAIIPLQTSEIHRKALIAVLQANSVKITYESNQNNIFTCVAESHR